jgi:ABC-type transport system involved in multi-copper enzyme maturation permease subunit
LIISTIREYLRKSTIILFLVFASGLILCTWFITPFTLGESAKIVRDIALSATSFIGIIMAVVFGSRLLYRDVKRKAVYCLLTRPVTIGEIIAGKFLGLAILIFFIECGLYLIIELTLLFIEGVFSPELLLSFPLVLLESYIILGFVFLVTAFSSPFMGTAMGIASYMLGHTAFDIKTFAIQPNTGISGILAHIVYFVVPNLEHFNIRTELVHGLPLSSERIIFSFCYGIIYVLLLLILSIILFKRRQYM